MNHLHSFSYGSDHSLTGGAQCVYVAVRGTSWGLLFSYFCIKCGNNMWVLSYHLVGRKYSACAYEVMFWIPHLGYFLTPQYSQRAGWVWKARADTIYGRALRGVPGCPEIRCARNRYGMEKGRQLRVKPRKISEAIWALCLGEGRKKKKSTKTLTHVMSWLSGFLGRETRRVCCVPRGRSVPAAEPRAGEGPALSLPSLALPFPPWLLSAGKAEAGCV